MRRTATARGATLLSLALLASLSTSPAWSQLSFSEVTDTRGLGQYPMARGMGSGVAAADYDGDGDVDLFLPTAGDFANRVYRNRGDGFFDEVAGLLGLDSTEPSRSGLWFDADGDGDLDLVVAGDYWPTDPPPPGGTSVLRLYLQQQDGSFIHSEESGIGDILTRGNQHRGGLAAGDLDDDGDLDLVVAVWGGDLKIFENSGDGNFTDISCVSGTPCVEDTYWQPFFLDVDGDTRTDLFLAVDFDPNYVLTGDSTSGFADLASSLGLDNAWNDMGIACGDVDADGDFDLYVTNIYDANLGTHNELFLREPTGVYTRAAVDLGVDDGGWGWGTTFADLDHDTDLDLGATNGFRNGAQANDPLRVFENLGAGLGFLDIAPGLGLDNDHWGSTLLAVDIDGDGDLDLLETARIDFTVQRLRLLDNLLTAGPTTRWISIAPRSSGPNTHAIGALVQVETDSGTQMRLISAGTSFLGQEPAVAHFGIADEEIRSVTVTWPEGGVSHLAEPGVNQRLQVSSELIFGGSFESGSLSSWTVVGSSP